jgi:hypothetical protein
VCENLNIPLNFHIYTKYNKSLENFDNCEEYINYKYSIGEVDTLGCTCYYGHLEVVKYLHSIGCECTNKAMDTASNYGYFEIVKYLTKNLK